MGTGRCCRASRSTRSRRRGCCADRASRATRRDNPRLRLLMGSKGVLLVGLLLAHRPRLLLGRSRLKCGWRGSNPHGLSTAGFWGRCVSRFRHIRTKSRRPVLQSVRLVVHAAGRGRDRSGRAASKRASRRASSCTTLAGRGTGLGRAASRTRWRCISASSLMSKGARGAPFQRAPRAKSEISCGVAVSKPTTSSIPGSDGSAIEKPFETVPTTTSRASMPDALR
jgi:hypothetical protein